MMIDIKNRVVRENAFNYVFFDELDTENRIFVSWIMFDKAVNFLWEKIKELEREGRIFENVYALPRGGLCLGVKLSYLSGLPLITNKSQINNNTIVVDDCTDTGRTLLSFKDNFTVVMFHKPTSIFKPNLYYEETKKQINFCWESLTERN